MNDTYTGAISLSIFGESHGPAVGATLSGLAAGVPVDEAYIAREMDKRRAAGKLSTKRIEPDKVHFLEIVEQLARQRELDEYLPEIKAGAERWAIARSGRSPRCAKQYIDDAEARIRRGQPLD